MVVNFAIQNSNLFQADKFSVLNIGMCCGLGATPTLTQTFSYTTNAMRIGATATSSNLNLVTRNVTDFERLEGIMLINWVKA